MVIYAKNVIFIRKDMTVQKCCGSFYIRLYNCDYKYLHQSFQTQSKNVIKKNSKLLITGADTAVVKTLQTFFQRTFRV